MAEIKQRPIRFRAWDRRTSTMYDTVWPTSLFVYVDSTDLGDGQYANRGINPKHLTLMQYTGLTDEQGTDIYESDVVGDYVGEHKGQPVTASGSWQEVLWEGCGFNLDPTKSYLVVGNIFQNGDLLNAKD